MAIKTIITNATRVHEATSKGIGEWLVGWLVGWCVGIVGGGGARRRHRRHWQRSVDC